MAGACLLAGPMLGFCANQVTLTWDPSTSGMLTGYHLCWGTESGVYTFTNTYPKQQITGVISNLAPNQVYYFAVQAFAKNGIVSPFSNETSFTNLDTNVLSTNVTSTIGTNITTNVISTVNTNISTNVTASVTNGPPVPPPLNRFGIISTTPDTSKVLSPPPAAPATRFGIISVAADSGNTVNNTPVQAGVAASLTGAGGLTGPASNGSGTGFPGIPPWLALALTNGQPNLNIGGTVGATVMIQATTNLESLDSWETITNVLLTDPAPAAASNQTSQANNILSTTFVPAAQIVQIPQGTPSSLQYFRVIMPYDYAVLGKNVLDSQGYKARLIVVNMPGIVCDDACYINQVGSFIHYDWASSTLQLESSGSTIRQIANTLANSLNLDWTSASEFTFTNGLGQIWATVVRTEPASSDPVAGQNPPTAPMVINF
jgi:hypothetical protein